MADEVKVKAEAEANGKKVFGTMVKVLLGLVLLALGILAIVQWWQLLLDIVKGSIGPFLILAGIIALAIAKE